MTHTSDGSGSARDDGGRIGDAEITLVREALRFADWAAGEGLCPLDDGVGSPEEFLLDYTHATGDEEWETIADRITARLRAPAGNKANRDALARAVSAPCEHGVADWETCPKCRGWSEG